MFDVKRSAGIPIVFFLILLPAAALPLQLYDPVRFHHPGDGLRVGAAYSAGLLIEAEIEEGWYLYSLLNSPDAGPIPTTFSARSPEVAVSGDITESTAEIKYDPNFGRELGLHSGRATFLIPLQFDPDSPLPDSIEVAVRYQACDDSSCLPPVERSVRVETVSAVQGDEPGFIHNAERFDGVDRGAGTVSSVSTDGEESSPLSTLLLLLAAAAVAGVWLYRRSGRLTSPDKKF